MTVVKRLSTLVLTLLLVHPPAPVRAAGSVRDYRRAHEHEILSEFMELLAIPNVASDRENIRRNAAAIMTMMQRREGKYIRTGSDSDRPLKSLALRCLS